jgi:hypothetical protein
MLAMMVPAAVSKVLELVAPVGDSGLVVMSWSPQSFAWLGVSLALLAALVLSWTRFRARSRWRAALDAFAEREINRRSHQSNKTQAPLTLLTTLSGTEE